MRRLMLSVFATIFTIGVIGAFTAFLLGTVAGQNILDSIRGELRPKQENILDGDGIADDLDGLFGEPDAALTEIAPDDPNSADLLPEIKPPSAIVETPNPANPVTPTKSDQTDTQVLAADTQAPSAPTAPNPPQAGTNYETDDLGALGFPDAPASGSEQTDIPEITDWRAELLAAYERKTLEAQLEHQLTTSRDQWERARLADRSPFGESSHDLAEVRDAHIAALSQFATDVTSMNDGTSAAVPSSSSSRSTRAMLTAGSLIPAILTSEIKSELPGTITALVSRDVFDVDLNRVVIPQGSQLLGHYDNQTASGQTRLFVVMERIRFPDGQIIDLENAPAVDQAGATGLSGKRNSNFLTAVFQGALLNLASNAIRGGAAPEPAGDLESAARIAVGQSLGTVADQHIQSTISKGAKFTIPSGTRFNVRVNKDYFFSDAGGVIGPQPTRFANQTNFTTPKIATNLVRTASTAPNSVMPYNRADYEHWIDEDGDCQNTRHELLEQYSTGGQVQKSQDGCFILHGRWIDPYSNQILTQAKDVEIDHVVPLAWAHYRGASAFNARQKRDFANDPTNLLAVSAALNKEKGAQSPLDWLPPSQSFKCQYILRFMRVVKKYQLTANQAEAPRLKDLQKRTCNA